MALPRSRTAWLASFLECQHEPSLNFTSRDDIGRYFATSSGVDTALAYIWPEVLRRCPGLKIATVRRHPVDVRESLSRTLGHGNHQPIVSFLTACLDNVEKVTRCPIFDYEGLNGEDDCLRLSEFCLGSFDRERWLEMKDRKIEADIPKMKDAVYNRMEALREVFAW